MIVADQVASFYVVVADRGFQSGDLSNFIIILTPIRFTLILLRVRAHKEYLRVAKKKNKSQKEVRKAVGKQVRYMRRDIKIIHALLDDLAGRPIPLDRKRLKLWYVMQEVYRQQSEMYRKKEHRTDDRIVNIYQPYVRPIVRGKEGKHVEFGAQIGVGLSDVPDHRSKNARHAS